MFNQKRFYVSYLQDAGMPMLCHAIIEAPDFKYAEKNWISLISAKGFACSPVGTLPYGYEELFELPSHMSNWTTTTVLEYYDEVH